MQVPQRIRETKLADFDPAFFEDPYRTVLLAE